jgi:phosphate transport system permease protein
VRRRHEKYYTWLVAAAAATAVVGVALIFAFVLQTAWPVLMRVGLVQFIFGDTWYPTRGRFGLLPLIAGSATLLIGALLLGAPAGVMTAIFLSEYCPKRLASLLRPAIDLLAGIPSVIYGFFGLITIVPIVRSVFGGAGFGPVAGSLILAVMILPTITSVSRDALEAVPRDYRLGGLALGATHWRTVYDVVVPSAWSGIVTSVVLGVGRAVGETMAVLMVIGNAPRFPRAAGQPISALTSQVALDMAYASGDHRTALFGIAALLLFITMGLVGVGRLTVRRQARQGRRR